MASVNTSSKADFFLDPEYQVCSVRFTAVQTLVAMAAAICHGSMPWQCAMAIAMAGLRLPWQLFIRKSSTNISSRVEFHEESEFDVCLGWFAAVRELVDVPERVSWQCVMAGLRYQKFLAEQWF